MLHGCAVHSQLVTERRRKTMDQKEIVNFNTLYSTYYKKSFLFTKSYIHDDLAAEDIASEALIKLWRMMKEKEVPHPLPLLLAMLKNKSLDYLKHERTKREVIETLADYYQQDLNIRISTLQACNPDEIFSEEVQRIIHTSLNSLPEQTRKVFEMSRFENLTVKEIANKLNLTAKGVEYHITKSLKVLRVSLKDYLPLFYFFFYFQ